MRVVLPDGLEGAIGLEEEGVDVVLLAPREGGLISGQGLGRGGRAGAEEVEGGGGGGREGGGGLNGRC
jgi:hypothetical protein